MLIFFIYKIKAKDLCAKCKQGVNMLHAFVDNNKGAESIIVAYLKQQCLLFPDSAKVSVSVILEDVLDV